METVVEHSSSEGRRGEPLKNKAPKEGIKKGEAQVGREKLGTQTPKIAQRARCRDVEGNEAGVFFTEPSRKWGRVRATRIYARNLKK